jgi:type II secretory pathway component PulK
MRRSPPLPRARSGSALVIVLIVVVVLSALVGSLAFEARLEAQ